jgi:Transposase DDE domain
MIQEARKLFNTIEQTLASKAHRKLLRVATNAYLEANGNPRPEHADGASASSLSRFLNKYDWNLRVLIRILRQNINRQLLNLSTQKRSRKHVLKLMLDLTSLEKTGEFPELPIHTLDQKRGLHIVVLYVVIGNQRFPWSFTVWQGKDTISPTQLALRMLKRIPNHFKSLFQPRVLADGGFGSDDFLEGCVRLGLPAVVGIRCDRRVLRIGIEQSDADVGTRLNTLKTRGTRVELHGCTIPVWVSWFKLKGKRKDGSFEWRYVVSTVKASGEAIIRWGRERWRIEAFFKTMKSRFGLDQFGQRTALGVYRFLTLAFMAFLLAFWVTLDKPSLLVDLDWAVVAGEARDAIMPEVRLGALRAEVIRLEALIEESRALC